MIKSWDDITISKWKEINEVQSETEISKKIEIISILTDKDPSELRALRVNDFIKLQSDFGWTSEAPKADLNIRFELEGKRYGMIPQLDFITAGEWLDSESWKDDSVGNIHLYAALLFRPITKEDGDVYEIEPHITKGFIERSNLFLNQLPITKIYGSVLFFLAFGLEFSKITQDYLPQIIQDQMEQMEKLTKTNQTQTPTKMHNEKPLTNNGEHMTSSPD